MHAVVDMLATAGMMLLMKVMAVIAAAEDGAVGGNFPAGVLNLERVLPLNHKVELEELIARDGARHSRILQNFAGGVVDFPVIGSSDQFLFGYLCLRLAEKNY